MMGIILAGGSGSRLRPITLAYSKQLQLVYNKPMIYYPLSTLMLAGIREFVIITTAQDQNAFNRLLGDGHRLGININYVTQHEPKGLAEAFPLSKSYIVNRKVALILGDNIFHGQHLGTELGQYKSVQGAQIFGYRVSNPTDYGVAETDAFNNLISIKEKPKQTKSNLAVPGLYFYDETVLSISEHIKPSSRGELEITDINNTYLKQNRISISVLPRGTAWLDTGTFGSLHDASSYIKAVEERQGLMISCIEEIAFRNGWISSEELLKQAQILGNGDYSKYLVQIALGNC